MRDNPGGELDPAVDDHRHCKKNSPSVLSCIGEQKKAVTVAVKSGQSRRSDPSVKLSRHFSPPLVRGMNNFWNVPHLSRSSVPSLALLLPFLTSGPDLWALPDY